MHIGESAALIGFVAAAVGRHWRDIPRLWRKPTDWNAVRTELGYSATPDRPIIVPKRRNPVLQFFLDLLPMRSMDRERARLGYGPK